MSVILLLVGVCALALTVTGVAPREPRPVPWVPSLVATELTVPLLAAHGIVAVVYVVLGWHAGWLGSVGLALLGASAAGLGVIQARTAEARPAMAEGVAQLLDGDVVLPPVPTLRLIDPRPRPPLGVRRQAPVRYGPDPDHLVEVIAGPGGAGPAPALLQVHGGGWTGGRLGRQGRPLLHRMAAAGWVVVEASYRRSPGATFPDHLVDVKRAIAWIRREAVELGVDPSFVGITGGSAGGHLAALAALTQNEAWLQPGFEEADTSVQACVPLYGVHDLLDETGRGPKWPYLATTVLKSHPTEDPDLWAAASPVDAPTSDRPPFFVVHGRDDTLVPAEDSRHLVEVLRGAGGPPVGYAEVPWANHGFDTFESVRGILVAEAAATVLQAVWAEHLAESEAGDGGVGTGG
ncbi:MAG: alpha/beta hydrolase [Acidimicrobiia bacterium]|nr:alpha/beta hydrolase [Acidimicrobiia bacterium]